MKNSNVDEQINPIHFLFNTLFLLFLSIFLAPFQAQEPEECDYLSARLVSVQANPAYVQIQQGQSFSYTTSIRYHATSIADGSGYLSYPPSHLKITRRIERYSIPSASTTQVLTQLFFPEKLDANCAPLPQPGPLDFEITEFCDADDLPFNLTAEQIEAGLTPTYTHPTDYPVPALPIGLYKITIKVSVTLPAPLNPSCIVETEDSVRTTNIILSVESPDWFCVSHSEIFPSATVDETPNPEDPYYNLLIDYLEFRTEEIDGREVSTIHEVQPGFQLPLLIGANWYTNSIFDLFGEEPPQWRSPGTLSVSAVILKLRDAENPDLEDTDPYGELKVFPEIPGPLPVDDESYPSYGSAGHPFLFSGAPGAYLLKVTASANPPALSGLFTSVCSQIGSLSSTTETVIFVEESPVYHKHKNEIGSSFQVGHNVNGFTGAFRQVETDISLPGSGIPFNWTRVSDSNFVHYDSEMGRSWWGPLLQRFYRQGAVVQNLLFKTAEGKTEPFVFDLETQKYVVPQGLFMEFVQDPELYEIQLIGEDHVKYIFYDAISGIEQLYARGRLKRIEDRFGNKLEIKYLPHPEYPDDEAIIDQIIDTYGRKIVFTHDAEGLITKIVDFSGREIKYEYYGEGEPAGTPGTSGNLKFVYLPEVPTTDYQHNYAGGNRIKLEYRYDAGHPRELARDSITQLLDGKGQIYLTNTYSSETNINHFQFGRVISQQYGGGSYKLYYQEETEADAITIPNDLGTAKMLVIENDRRGLVKHVYANDKGNPLTVFNYTGFADKTSVTTLSSNRPTGKLRTVDPEFFVTSASYNEEGLVTQMVYPKGNIENYEYFSTPVRHGQNNITKITQIPQGGGTPLVSTFTYTNNSLQKLKTSTDPKGNVTTYFYDQDEFPPPPEEGSPPQEGTDHNGDGVIGGNLGVVVKIQHPSVTEGLAANGGPQESSELFRYNSYGQVTQQTDAEGKITQYTYYPATNPTGALAVTDPPAGASGVTGGQLNTVVIDPTTLALTTAFQYNSVGNLTQKTDANGRIFTYFVNEHNQITKMLSPVMSAFTDDAGAQYETITWYDANGNVEKTWTEHQNSGNDSDADVAGFESQNHFETQFTYDLLDNITKVKKEALNHAEMEKSLVQIYDYDENENVTKVRYSEGSSADKDRVVYDERDMVFKQIIGAGSGEESVTRFNYTQNGNLKKVISPNTANTLTYTYDGFDRPEKIENAIDTKVVLEYDENSNVVEQRVHGELIPGGSIELLSKVQNSYDQRNRPFTRTFFRRDLSADQSMGTVLEQVGYQKNNQVFKTINANNHASEYIYDNANRLKEAKDAFQNQQIYSYDNNSNVLSVVSIEKNSAGAEIGNFTNTFLYDELNRVRETKDNLNHITHVKLDSRGMAVVKTSAEGHLTQTRYDGLGRTITAQMAAQDGVITHQNIYDKRSRLTKFIDGNNKGTEYSYDAHNRLILRKNANNTQRQYFYDDESNLTRVIRENGTKVDRTYDNLNRLTRIFYKTNTEAVEIEDEFSYNGLNHLLRAETLTSAVGVNSGSKIEYKRDNRGLALATTQQIWDEQAGTHLPTKTFTNTYDKLGSPLTMTYPNGRVVTYAGHNELEIPTKVKTNGFDTGVSGNDLAKYTYHGQGRVKSRKFNQNAELNVDYDDIKRVNTFTHKLNSVVQAKFKETYNKEHSLRAEEYLDPSQGIHEVRVLEMDPHQRAIGFVKGLPPSRKNAALNNFASIAPTEGEDYQAITYDESNNIEAIQRKNGAVNFTQNEMNETTAISGLRSNIEYDALGRINSYVQGNDQVVYTWNGRDQLTSVKKNGKEIASYDYYPSGSPMRSLKRVAGKATESFYGVNTSIHEIRKVNASGLETAEPVKEFVYEGIDAPIAMFVDGDNNPTTGTLGGREAYFFHTNPRGDIYAQSDSSGNIVQRFDFSLSGHAQSLAENYALQPKLIPPSGSFALVIAGQPYTFPALVANTTGGGSFSLTFESSTETANYATASFTFDALVEIDTNLFKSDCDISGITGEGTIRLTLSYTEGSTTASVPVVLTVVPSAVTVTLDFSASSPVAFTLGDPDLDLRGIGTPEGGTYAITSTSTITGATISEIDSDTGFFTFSEPTTAGIEQIDVTYTFAGETAKASLLIVVLEADPDNKIKSPFAFGGAYHDEETGLIYMRNRYYDPSSHTFLSRDPKEDDSLGNLYAAFENNPGSLKDPSGLNPYDPRILIGQLIEWWRGTKESAEHYGNHVGNTIIDNATMAYTGPRYGLGEALQFPLDTFNIWTLGSPPEGDLMRWFVGVAEDYQGQPLFAADALFINTLQSGYYAGEGVISGGAYLAGEPIRITAKVLTGGYEGYTFYDDSGDYTGNMLSLIFGGMTSRYVPIRSPKTTKSNLKLNFYGSGEAPAFIDVTPETMWIKDSQTINWHRKGDVDIKINRKSTSNFPSHSADRIFLRGTGLGPSTSNPNTISEMLRLSKPGTNIDLLIDKEIIINGELDNLLKQFGSKAKVTWIKKIKYGETYFLPGFAGSEMFHINIKVK